MAVASRAKWAIMHDRGAGAELRPKTFETKREAISIANELRDLWGNHEIWVIKIEKREAV